MNIGKIIDITGQKFGRLTVIERDFESSNKGIMWICQCDCANRTIKSVAGSDLKKGSTKSCGCLREEFRSINATKHGYGYTRVCNIYHLMMNRCYNNKFNQYKDYGGRGIIVNDEWRGENGFINFKNWAFDNGYSEKLTLDRKDVNGNYEPDNCRWITLKEQQNNKRNNHYVTINGRTETAMKWSEISKVNYQTILSRLAKGWVGEDILSCSRSIPSEKQSGVIGVNYRTNRDIWEVYIKSKFIGSSKDLKKALKIREDYLLKEGVFK